METNETLSDLEIGIGSKEATSLQPAKVTILGATVEEVGEKKAKKVVCQVKHPDKEENIKISSMVYLKGNTLENSGTWLNKDEDGLIRKNSALAVLLGKVGASSLADLEGKEIETELDAKGYLTFKAY
jgi:hypothetical protein